MFILVLPKIAVAGRLDRNIISIIFGRDADALRLEMDTEAGAVRPPDGVTLQGDAQPIKPAKNQLIDPSAVCLAVPFLPPPESACIGIECMHDSLRGGMAVAMLTVRHLPDEVHRALRARAARHGRSMEAEVRNILEDAVSPPGRIRLGSLLGDIGRQAGLSDEEFAVFDTLRDRSPAPPVNFD